MRLMSHKELLMLAELTRQVHDLWQYKCETVEGKDFLRSIYKQLRERCIVES